MTPVFQTKRKTKTQEDKAHTERSYHAHQHTRKREGKGDERLSRTPSHRQR